MAPTVHSGDVLHVENVNTEELRNGDIVLFREGMRFRAHRLVAIDRDRGRFVTQGDAFLQRDSSISATQIIGRIIVRESKDAKCQPLFAKNFTWFGRCRAQAVSSIRGLWSRLFSGINALERMRVAKETAARLSFAGLLVLLTALPLRAQVTIGNTVSAQDEINRNNLTITTGNITPAGTNRLLLVGVSIDINNNPAETVTGVTFNGTPLVQLGTRNDTANDHRVEMWYLLNPPAAAHTVSVTFSNPGGSIFNPTQIGAAVGAIALSDVDQTTPLGSFVSAQGGTSGGSTINVPSGTGQVVVDTLAIDGRRTPTAGAGQTRRWGLNSGNGNGTDVYGFGSTEAGTSTVTMSETFSGTSGWAMGAVSVMPIVPTLTAPFTVTGTNNVLIVGVSMNISGNTGATVSSVTYNGVALTSAGFHNDAGNTRRVEIWYLVAPAVGTHNIVVNLSGVAGAVVGATNVSGADQTSPIRNFAFADGAADALSTLDVPSANGDTVVDTLAIAGTDSVTADGPTQTQVWASSSGGATTDVYGSGSSRAGASSVPLSETFNANSNWSLGAVSVRPFEADLSISVAGNAVAFPGNVTYTILVANNGPSTATGVTMTDPLPAGLTFVSVTGAGCSQATGTVTCNIGTLASGSNSTITITATPAVGGGYPDTATVSTTSTTPDLNTGNNSAIGIAYSQLNVCTIPTTTAGGTLTGVINTYYPGTASVAAGATSISVGTPTGSATPIAAGDEILIIQMQDAAISSNNDGTYGDGSTGSGFTSLNNAGIYEFATATSAVTGGALQVAGAGPNGGLLFGYNFSAATTTQGQRTFQVVRVPHFATATLGAGLTAAAWNGSTGGIFVLDTSGALTLNGQTVSVNGLGFRGGAGLELNGGVAGSSTNDYRQLAPTTYPAGPAFTGVPVNGIDGPKGEGIAGTPRWLEVANTPFSTGAEGYPNGSMGRGAPGNAGGGGTDANNANDQNSGGGGGANGGSGGFGGDAWNSNLSVGGLGGSAFPSSSGRVVMGGGGGAGSRNNSDNNAAGALTRIAQASSGAAGGGIIIVRAGSITGTGTMSANGSDAYNLTSNDAGGGGGAGGSVIVLSTGGTVGTLTVNARGGRGGDAWDDDATAGPPLADRHGPGGGGGGGVVMVSSATNVTINVTGGAHGTTLPAPGQYQYGATDGAAGSSATNITYASTPGPHFNATCIDVTLTKTAPTTALLGSGFSYSLTIKNNGTTAASTVQLKDTLPAGVTFSSVTPAASCSQAAGTVTCNFATLAAGASTSVTINVIAATLGTVTNTGTVTETQADYNLVNNTASATTTITSSADVSIVKGASANPVITGSGFSYILTVTNSGPSNAGNVVVSDPIPAGVTYSSNSTTQGTCSFAAGTVTCNLGALNAGATAIITINAVAGPPARVTNTATVTATEPDPNLTNNTSTFVLTITFTTEVKLESFTATSTGGGTLLAWRTAGEVRNLGFNVYREVRGRRERLNPSLIAGSSLMMRRADLRHSGKSYAWLDRSSGSGGYYWLEDVDLNGTRAFHGPVAVQGASPNSMGSSAARMTSKLARAAHVSPGPEASTTVAELNSSIARSASPLSHLQRLIEINPVTRSAGQMQFQIASGAAIKINVDHEGWYHVSQPQLVAAGLSPFVNPASLRLYAEGIEQPILITGSRNGSGGFGSGAAIEFYGTGVDTPYANQRVYWLVSGNQGGSRIRYAVTGGSGSRPQSFPQTVELEEKTTFFAALLRNVPDHFFGAFVSPTPVDQVLTATNLSPQNESGKLEVVLQGVNEQSHDVTISLNGVSLGDLSFAGQDEGAATYTIPHDLLRDGDNTVTLTAQDGEEDFSFVDHILLTYPHSYTADSDELKFTAQGGDSISIHGFTQAPTQVLDITSPNAPVILPFDVRGTQGNYTLNVKVAGFQSVTHTILALAGDQVGQPVSITANQPSSWHTAQAGADVVMISAPDFLTQVGPLVQLRRSQGKSVALVNVQDIYDEFNFGEKDPAAIREFLQTASSRWRQAPQYLLLVGDASMDPLNHLGFGYFDFVPTALVPTEQLTTASDDWFSDFANTGFAQIATGRLPVRTPEEAQTVVGKILGYENGQTAGPWTNQALMVADADDGIVPFTQQAQTIQSLLPPSLTVTDVFASSMTPDAARQAVLAAINNGQLLVNYDGHGSVEVWSDENLMTDETASSLTNGSRLPVFVIMNCLNGYFHDVFTESMAESLLLSNNGGAVAVWASSGLTSPDPQFQMDEAFTKVVFAPGETLGDAIQAAKNTISDSDVRRTFILFGDPLMHLQRPAVSPSSTQRRGRSLRSSSHGIN
jgi:uncharacterized repeat protein (TIGR01451 family)